MNESRIDFHCDFKWRGKLFGLMQKGAYVYECFIVVEVRLLECIKFAKRNCANDEERVNY